MDEPPVTWLIPILNGMPFLLETLASIEAQTYRNWTVLIWDNGSTDGTLEELARWIPSRLPGRVVSDRPFESVGASLAALVDAAETELLARIDADDIALPDRLANQVDFMVSHPEIASAGGQMDVIDETGKVTYPYANLPEHHDDLLNDLLVRSPIGHPSVILRRSAILEVGNYANVRHVEDYDLWLRLACKYRLANIPQTVLRYRIHSRSTTVQAVADNRLEVAAHSRFILRAPKLYGCSEEEARGLCEHSLPYAWPVLLRICSHLEVTQGLSAKERLRTKSFLLIARLLLAPTDWRTHFHLAIREAPLRGIIRGIGLTVEAMLNAAGLGRVASSLRKIGGRAVPYESD